ncbi:hypothetical protein ABH897_005155 [Paenibacillus sp. RC73]|uniref:hypothetical protein n=1 Tax=Paenibacillus sp. RC73 TaxID=3156250 RepID=UPI003832727E
MIHPTEPEIQNMIETIVSVRPTHAQLKGLVRNIIKESPANLLPQNCTVPVAVDIIVERAVQLGVHEQLMDTISNASNITSEFLYTSTSLDIHIANQFGQTFVELLTCLQEMSEEEFQRYTAEIDKADITNFEEKLKQKAGFSEDMQQIAKISKIDISVLQRTAKKLGFLKYNQLKKRVVKVYLRVKDKYPPTKFSADYRFQRLLDEMFECLPDAYKNMINIDDQITGIIFDTTYDCLIFNE